MDAGSFEDCRPQEFHRRHDQLQHVATDDIGELLAVFVLLVGVVLDVFVLLVGVALAVFVLLVGVAYCGVSPGVV